MEMYLDDSSSERKIIWHILKVGIPLELLKPPPASSLPGARPRGGRTARSRQGVARAPWCQVILKRFLLERRTGLIEDLPKSIPIFDFFFFLWIKWILCVEFLKISIYFLTMKIERCISWRWICIVKVFRLSISYVLYFCNLYLRFFI